MKPNLAAYLGENIGNDVIRIKKAQTKKNIFILGISMIFVQILGQEMICKAWKSLK